jgi:hypothetical protein
MLFRAPCEDIVAGDDDFALLTCDEDLEFRARHVQNMENNPIFLTEIHRA